MRQFIFSVDPYGYIEPYEFDSVEINGEVHVLVPCSWFDKHEQYLEQFLITYQQK